MKKQLIALILALVMLCMAGCGKSEAAKAVDGMILNIGTVTLDSKAQLMAIDSAIAALTEDQKAELENMAILVAAQSTYDTLAEEARVAEVKAQAAALDAQIEALGTVTLENEAAVAAVRSAYDAADAELQGYVTKLDVLEAAELELGTQRANGVAALIDAIGTVTLNSEEAITAAKDAFNALSAADRELVSNASVLTDAVNALKDLRAAEAQRLLAGMRKEEDLVRNIAFYYPQAFPYYAAYGYWGADVRCFALPYMGVQGDNVWLRLVCDYTSGDWIFFEKIIFAVDEERYYKYFNYYDVVRDNAYGDIWEYVDIDVGAEEIEMLRAIADSTTTIIRFEGDNYYDDFTVTQADKNAIRDILKVYDALKG